MWERATTLLDRAPFYAVARPLAGAALGAVVGALYGALCGGLHAALTGLPPLLVSWFLLTAAGGTVAGLIMGVCMAVDRAVCGPGSPPAPRPRRVATPPANGHAVPPRDRAPDPTRRLRGASALRNRI